MLRHLITIIICFVSYNETRAVSYFSPSHPLFLSLHFYHQGFIELKYKKGISPSYAVITVAQFDCTPSLRVRDTNITRYYVFVLSRT